MKRSRRSMFMQAVARSTVGVVCLAVVAASGSTLTPPIAAQTKATTVGVLSFQDESGVNAPAELGQRLAQHLRQRLNTSYKDVVARAITGGGSSPTETMSVDQLITLGKQSGVKVVVRGGILALDSEGGAEETRISVQLYAEVVSVDSGLLSTVRAEGVGQQKGAAADKSQLEAVLASNEFSTSALGLAVSNAAEQLAGLVYQSLTATGPQQPSIDGAIQPAAPTVFENDAAVSADDELKQLIAQAEGLLTNPGAISSDGAASLDRAVRALKDALALKAALLERGKDTNEADQDVTARKEELQAALGRITAEAASATASPGAEGVQLSGQKKNKLATISEYLGETVTILQKIQEMRAAFRSANEDPSLYGGMATPTTITESTQPVEEPIGGVQGVVTDIGSPVEGVTVTDVESGATTTTDSSGSYSLNGVIAGKLAKLILTKGGKQIGASQVDVPRGRSGVADFDLKASAQMRGARVIPSNVLITATSLRPGARTGQLQGVVEDAQGNPVARALVQLKDMGFARTDSRGRYSFFNVPVGAHQLTVQGAGLRAVSEQVQVSAAGVAGRRIKLSAVLSAPVREALILRGSGAALRGTVRDSDNRPVEGAKVTVLLGGQALSAVTGPQGSYELRDLKPASYRVIISKAGLESWSQTVELRSAQEQSVRLRKSTGIVPSLIAAQRARQGEIRGQLRWSSGQPIGGALIEVKPLDRPYPVLKTVTGSNGEYMLKLNEGNYEVKVREGAQAISKVIVVRAGSTSRHDFALKRLDVASSARIILGQGTTGRTGAPNQQIGTVGGRVTDARRGMPVEGAVVLVEGSVRQNVRTDRAGNYSFANLPPGTYRVIVRINGFAETSREAVVRMGAYSRQDFALEPVRVAETGARRSQFPPAGAIRPGQIAGRILESRGGRPIPGASVSLLGQRWLLTDAQGSFVIGNLMPGSYKLVVSKPGFVSNERVIAVRGGDSVTVSITLNPSGPIRR